MFLYSQSNQKYKYKECMVAQTQKTFTMNYLIKYTSGPEIGKFAVISNVTKDWSKFIGKSASISLGNSFFKVIQEIKIL